MGMRSTIVFVSGSMSLLAACTSDVPGPGREEPVGQSQSSIIGGNNDAIDAVANVVVDLRRDDVGQCSGTLLTPLLVLTAGHCFVGAAGESRPALDTANSNTLVLDPGGHSHAVRLAGFAALPTSPVGDADIPNDVALVFLDQAEFAGSSASPLLELFTRRPSFTIPPSTIEGNLYTFQPGLVGFSGWGTFRTSRQVATMGSLLRSSGIWTLGVEGVQGQIGDSGSPLFSSALGTRDVFAVQSATQGTVTLFADITQASVAAWIRSRALDTTRNAARSPSWYQRHGKRVDDHWYGEVDYVGPCRAGDDLDCDHWFIEHDNCPFVFNPGQDDSDDDGVGDACDDCPRAYDPEQANCNLFAETHHETPRRILGDKCDPVPCPQSTFDAATPITTCCPADSTGAKTCVTRAVHNLVHTVALGAHPVDGVLGPGQDNFAHVLRVATSVRFCQENRALGFRCDLPSVLHDSQALLNEPPAPRSDRPWHRISFGKSQIPSIPPQSPPRGQDLRFDYGVSVDDNTWFYQQDFAFWTTDPIAPGLPFANFPACTQVPVCGTTQPNHLVSPGSCLSGTFWLHADTPVGDTQSVVNGVDVGLHEPPSLGGVPVELANAYIDLVPDPARGYCLHPSSPLAAAAIRPGGFRPTALWQSSGADRVVDIRAFPYTELLAPSPVGLVAAIQPDAAALVLGDDGGSCTGSSVSNALARSFASRVWASVVEPNARIGVLRNVMAVGLSADGTRVTDAIVEQGGRLVSARETAISIGHPFDPPAPRSGFATFFSRAAGGVFLLGGIDRSGTALHDLWFQPLGRDWREIAFAGPRLGDVEAATFSFADLRLMVVDQVGEHRRDRQARIVRVDPVARTSSVLFATPVHHSDRTAFLSVDRDGSILLAVSDPRSRRTRVARLGIAGAHLSVSRIRTGSGVLAREIIVDDHAYGFPLLESNGTIRIVRKERLHTHVCDSDDEGESRDDEVSVASDCGLESLRRFF